MRTFSLICLVSLTACTGPGSAVDVSGKNLVDFFPFDGVERSWTYESDTELDHRLHAVRSEEPRDIEGTSIWTVQSDLTCIDPDDTECVESHYRTYEISAEAGSGVLLHSLAIGDGEVVDFDTPIQLGDRDTIANESWVTETNDATITVTFTGSEDCAIRWTDNWNDCVVLDVDDGGANTGLAGTIWAVASWNMVAFEIGDDTGRWELSSAVFEG